MPNGLFTPGLVLEVAEAAEDSVITPAEFSSIISVVTGIFMGAVVVVFIAMLIKPIFKGFTKETGVKIPVYG